MLKRVGYPIRFLVMGVVCLSVVGGVAAAPGGPAGLSDTTGDVPSPGQDADSAVQSNGTASFDGGVFEEERGDVVEVTVSLEGIDTATVRIGSVEEVNYALETTVRDAGDGRVTIRFNSYTAGTSDDGNQVVEVTGDDEVVSVSESGDFTDAVSDPANGTLASVRYGLRVWPGPESAGDANDVGSVELNTRGFLAIQTYVAPNGSTLDSAETIRTRQSNGSLVRDTTVPRDGTLVHEIELTGIEGVLQYRRDGGATDATEVFLAEVDAGGLFGLNVTGPDGSRLPVNGETVGFLADADSDTYYLVYRTEGAADVTVGGSYETSLTVRPLSSSGGFTSERTVQRNVSWDVTEPVATPTLTATPTPTPTVTPTPTASPTVAMDETPTSTVPAETAMPTDTTPTRTATPTDRDEATEGSGPGFGVGVAVLSLLAFAVRSARRSRQE